MKKKILMSVTTMAMTFAMATSAIAAPTPTESGDVDGNGVVNSNDSSMIQKEAVKDNDLANGNFDGYWDSKSDHMGANDARRSLEWVLTPEKMVETVGVRAYTLDNSQTTGGFGSMDFATTIWDELYLDSARTPWNQQYENKDAKLVSESNHTIDETLEKAATLVDSSDASREEFGKFISGVAFKGFGKNTGKEIFLTSDEGWGVFAVAMREIVPLSQEDFVNSGYANNIDEVFDGNYGIVGAAPYTSVSELPADLQQRAVAFNALKSAIVTNKAHSEGVNDTNIKNSGDVSALYEQFKIAFPGREITEAEFRKTCDHFGAIYTRRYNVVVDDKDGSDVIDGNVNGENNSATINKMAAAKLYNYMDATLQDVRDSFGDIISLSTTKDGEKTWGFTIEIYSQYKPVSELNGTKLN